MSLCLGRRVHLRGVSGCGPEEACFATIFGFQAHCGPGTAAGFCAISRGRRSRLCAAQLKRKRPGPLQPARGLLDSHRRRSGYNRDVGRSPFERGATSPVVPRYMHGDVLTHGWSERSSPHHRACRRPTSCAWIYPSAGSAAISCAALRSAWPSAWGPSRRHPRLWIAPTSTSS
jgi:hypothetical protein